MRLRNPFTFEMAPLDDPSDAELEELTELERIQRLEGHARTTLVERHRIVGLQLSQVRGVVACVALLIVFGGLYGKHLTHNTQVINTVVQRIAIRHDALHDYQVASCKRANDSRALTNRSNRDEYLFDTQLATLLTTALAEPEVRNPGVSESDRQRNRADFEAFTSHLAGFGRDQEWRALIPNCEAAVDHPQLYHAPPPVKFSQEDAPHSALYVEHGRGLDE
jgi:hypothetical protein